MFCWVAHVGLGRLAVHLGEFNARVDYEGFEDRVINSVRIERHYRDTWPTLSWVVSDEWSLVCWS